LALAALALLSGCGAMRPVDGEQAARLPLYEARAARLELLPNWSLEGRLAVSDERDGGSGFLSWRQQPGASRMDFHGALGRGAWRLQAREDGAELEFADGRQYRADSIDELVRAQVGWEVPVETLAWWVRGLVAPGRFQRRVLDEEGHLSLLQQDGWNIEFGRYATAGSEAMPLKMTARQQDRTVKLAIRKWELSAAHEQPH
jgi:outer membrane lipoprotein LolB